MDGRMQTTAAAESDATVGVDGAAPIGVPLGFSDPALAGTMVAAPCAVGKGVPVAASVRPRLEHALCPSRSAHVRSGHPTGALSEKLQAAGNAQANQRHEESVPEPVQRAQVGHG